MTKIRYPYINNPYGFKLPDPKPKIHPVITKFEEFSENDKIILLEIKYIVTSYLGECKVYVFGSRIKGNWNEESDYDIAIVSDKQDVNLRNRIRNHIYSVEVDIMFGFYDEMVEIVN